MIEFYHSHAVPVGILIYLAIIALGALSVNILSPDGSDPIGLFGISLLVQVCLTFVLVMDVTHTMNQCMSNAAEMGSFIAAWVLSLISPYASYVILRVLNHD